jgi:hypothetical protein
MAKVIASGIILLYLAFSPLGAQSLRTTQFDTALPCTGVHLFLSSALNLERMVVPEDHVNPSGDQAQGHKSAFGAMGSLKLDRRSNLGLSLFYHPDPNFVGETREFWGTELWFKLLLLNLGDHYLAVAPKLHLIYNQGIFDFSGSHGEKQDDFDFDAYAEPFGWQLPLIYTWNSDKRLSLNLTGFVGGNRVKTEKWYPGEDNTVTTTYSMITGGMAYNACIGLGDFSFIPEIGFIMGPGDDFSDIKGLLTGGAALGVKW